MASCDRTFEWTIRLDSGGVVTIHVIAPARTSEEDWAFIVRLTELIESCAPAPGPS